MKDFVSYFLFRTVLLWFSFSSLLLLLLLLIHRLTLIFYFYIYNCVDPIFRTLHNSQFLHFHITWNSSQRFRKNSTYSTSTPFLNLLQTINTIRSLPNQENASITFPLRGLHLGRRPRHKQPLQRRSPPLRNPRAPIPRNLHLRPQSPPT